MPHYVQEHLSTKFRIDKTMAPEDSLVGTPEKILAAVGFLPFSTRFEKPLAPRNKTLDKASLYIAVVFVLGGALCGCIDIAGLVYDAMEEPTTAHTNPVLHAMSQVSDGIFPFQPVIVLSIFLFKRNSWWYNVQDSMRKVVSFGNLWVRKKAVWKQIGTTLSCVTLMLTVLFEYGEWHAFMEQNSQYYSTDSDNASDSFPIRYTPTQDIVIWAVFCSLPHYFTQQVYICVIVYAVVLRDACGEFLVKIGNIREQLINVQNKDNVIGAVRELQEFLLELIICANRLNDMYSWILFIIFTSNLALSCSFLTAIVVVSASSLTGSIAYYISVLLFFSYSVLFAIPLVQVYDKAGQFALKLCALRLELKSSVNAEIVAENGLAIVHLVQNLENAARNHVPCFTGGGLVWYSRGLLTAACTFLVSTGLVVQQIASNYACESPSVYECLPCGSNSTSNHTRQCREGSL